MPPPRSASRPAESPVRTDRAGKAEAEKKAILAAAYRLLGRGKDVGVQDILAEAGLSTRAFYRHFRSKDELILSMFATASGRFLDELVAAVSSAPGPAEALEAFVRRHLAVVYDQRSARQAIVLSTSEARAVEGYVEAEWQAMSKRRALVAGILEEGRAAGVFTTVTDPLSDGRAVLGVVGAVIDEHLGGGAVPDWDGAVRHTTELLLRAFGHRPTPRRRVTAARLPK